MSDFFYFFTKKTYFFLFFFIFFFRQNWHTARGFSVFQNSHYTQSVSLVYYSKKLAHSNPVSSFCNIKIVHIKNKIIHVNEFYTKKNYNNTHKWILYFLGCKNWRTQSCTPVSKFFPVFHFCDFISCLF